MNELKKLERYLRINMLGTRPSSYEKRIYWAAVSQMLRNTALQYSTPELSASILHLSLISTTHTWTNTLADDIPVSTTGHNIYFLLDQNILQLLTHFAHFAHCFHVNEMVIAPSCRVTVSNFKLVQCGSQVPSVTNAPFPVVQSTHNHCLEWPTAAHNGLLR